MSNKRNSPSKEPCKQTNVVFLLVSCFLDVFLSVLQNVLFSCWCFCFLAGYVLVFLRVFFCSCWFSCFLVVRDSRQRGKTHPRWVVPAMPPGRILVQYTPLPRQPRREAPRRRAERGSGISPREGDDLSTRACFPGKGTQWHRCRSKTITWELKKIKEN